MTFDKIIHEILAPLPDATERMLLVITGGEPMLQDAIVPFIVKLRNERGWMEVQIESNGDRLPTGFSALCSHVDLVVSPKVVNGAYRPLKPEVFGRTNSLKFVIDYRSSSPYYSVPEWARPKRPRVYLSPITVYKRPVNQGEVPNAWDQQLIDHDLTALNYARVAHLCKTDGWRASMQQHLFFGIE